jgi:hypothetical protein
MNIVHVLRGFITCVIASVPDVKLGERANDS